MIFSDIWKDDFSAPTSYLEGQIGERVARRMRFFPPYDPARSFFQPCYPERRRCEKIQNLFTAEYSEDAEGIYIHCFHRSYSSAYLRVLRVLCGERFFHTFAARDLQFVSSLSGKAVNSTRIIKT
jgi:hypothetical protein